MADPVSEREPIEELAESFLARFRAGQRPPLTELVAAHPELAEEIRELFPALIEMEQAGSAIGPATAAARAPMECTMPESLGDYRVIREIGRGGMGVVYEAEQKALGRRVALKVLPAGLASDVRRGPGSTAKRAAACLHHTNIVPVFDVGHADGQVFYVMQMIQGDGLDLVIDELRRLRYQTADAQAATSIAASLIRGRFARANLAETELVGNAVGSNEETAGARGSPSSSAVLPGQSDLASAGGEPCAYFRSVGRLECRSRARWHTPTPAAWSIATSSPPTCCSTRRGWSG